MPDLPVMERLQGVVRGRVQGVGFRYFVQQNAVELAITGWVRNTWDGSVEFAAEGAHASLLRLLGLLYQGPPSALVDDVESEWLPATGEFASFRVRF